MFMSFSLTKQSTNMATGYIWQAPRRELRWNHHLWSTRSTSSNTNIAPLNLLLLPLLLRGEGGGEGGARRPPRLRLRLRLRPLKLEIQRRRWRGRKRWHPGACAYVALVRRQLLRCSALGLRRFVFSSFPFLLSLLPPLNIRYLIYVSYHSVQFVQEVFVPLVELLSSPWASHQHTAALVLTDTFYCEISVYSLPFPLPSPSLFLTLCAAKSIPTNARRDKREARSASDRTSTTSVWRD